jgi:hypothetical protein
MGRTDGTRYFFLSIVGMSVLSAFSQITYGSKWESSAPLNVLRGANGTHWDAIWVLLSDALSFCLALLC